jgi:hypothetical protein
VFLRRSSLVIAGSLLAYLGIEPASARDYAGQRIVNMARNFKGTPYVTGGTDLPRALTVMHLPGLYTRRLAYMSPGILRSSTAMEGGGVDGLGQETSCTGADPRTWGSAQINRATLSTPHPTLERSWRARPVTYRDIVGRVYIDSLPCAKLIH